MDPAQTRRVILLVDLHPLLAIQDPSQYITSVLAAARRLLFFPPLSGSLFAFKPFFSSLSPLISSSWIHRFFGKSMTFLSFDRPSQVFELLSNFLRSGSLGSSNCDGDLAGRLGWPRASLIRDSLFQLAYDCMWEPPREISEPKNGISSVRSNMVVNFSPMPLSQNSLTQFLDMSVDDETTFDASQIRTQFSSVFGPLNELLVSKDVHFSWIHADLDSLLSLDLRHKKVFEQVIRDIGWSICSADAVALGGVFIPFGLIYSYIGYRLPSYSIGTLCPGRADLNLEISDVCGKPLQCKCCDLDLHLLKKQGEMSGILDIFPKDSQASPRITVKDVFELSCHLQIKSRIQAAFLLRPASGIDERVDDKTNESLPEKIFELFREDGVFVPAVGKPTWQLLLAFLRRRNFYALVSVDHGNGQHLHGYMIPFTVHSAVMYVVDGLILDTFVPSCSEQAKDKSHRRKKHRFQSLIQELDVDCLRKHIFSGNNDANLEIEMENLYFAKGGNISKKLRFFHCWMKQFKNRNHSSADVSGRGTPSDCKEIKEERSETSEQETAFQCVEENEEYPSRILLESTESFTEGVSQKTKRVLSSKESDLSAFAERIVKLAAHYFSSKHEDGEREDVAGGVMKALLGRPKDIAAKYKTSGDLDEIDKVREHELQILIRMEILQSAIGASIEERGRSKIVSDVCSLLQNIEFNLQGNMFAGESLIEFAARTIRARYSSSLESVVRQIYEQMEFVSFVDGEEDSASIPYSNSSEQQRDDKDDVTPSEHNNSEGCENALTKAREKRERAGRFSHFASGRQNLQRVWAPRQARKKKPAKERSSSLGVESSSKKSKRPPSGKDAVCETPMVRDRHHHSTGYGARVSKALFGVRD